jgi:RHS repeat-associated protein
MLAWRREGTRGANAQRRHKRAYVGGIFEKVIGPSGLVEEKNYIMTPLGRTAVYTQRSDSIAETRYLHQDGFGTVYAVTDEFGCVEKRFVYDPWGKQVETMDNHVRTGGQMTRGYTDHEMLSDFGLIHMNGRVYDPTIARFLSCDPVVQDIGDSQTYNRYSYCANNPVNFSDPTGLSFMSELVDILKAIGDFFTGGDGGNKDSESEPPNAGDDGSDKPLDQSLINQTSDPLQGQQGVGSNASKSNGGGGKTPSNPGAGNELSPKTRVAVPILVNGKDAYWVVGTHEAVAKWLGAVGPNSTVTKTMVVAIDGAGGAGAGDNPRFRQWAKSLGAETIYDGKALSGSGTRKQAYADVKKFHEGNPKGRILLLGYSAGGDEAVALANMLGKDKIGIDTMITFDPHQKNFFGYKDYKLTGDNVATALNFYQRNELQLLSGTNPFRGSPIEGATNYNLTGFPTDHVNIVTDSLKNYGDVINAALNK